MADLQAWQTWFDFLMQRPELELEDLRIRWLSTVGSMVALKEDESFECDRCKNDKSTLDTHETLCTHVDLYWRAIVSGKSMQERLTELRPGLTEVEWADDASTD